MLQIKTLEDLKKEIGEYEADTNDSMASQKTLDFAPGNGLHFTPDMAGGSTRMAGIINDWSFTQICGRLNAPGAWLGDPDKCPEELKIDILNQLASKYRDDTNLLIRMKGEVIRAILSSRYSKFDNMEFVDLVGDAVATMGEGMAPQIIRSQVGDELRSYVCFPQITLAPDPEKRDTGGLHPSLYISNSERGGGSAKVAGAVFRTVCSNGMIYGWRSEDTFEARHIFKSRAAMGLLVAEGIAEGLRLSEEATDRFIKAQDIKIPQISLAGIVDNWVTKYGISVEAKENWLAAISHETIENGRKNDTRLFDLVNSATYVAQTRRPDETELMERAAGDILSSYFLRTAQPVER
ncbi:MAG: DUF932 domain-containing protein [Bacteroidales bacterium]|jgi:hypothetical protein